MPADPPLAELHLHLYGCLRADAVLDRLARRRPDIGWYEDAYEEAYGLRPPTRSLIERHRSGDPTARSEFEEIFVFGEDDAGNFDRFQAKFNLLSASSALRDDDIDAVDDELAQYIAAIRADHGRRGIGYAEHRVRLRNRLDTPIARRYFDRLLAEFDSPGGTTERVAVSLWRSDPWAGWDRTQEMVLGDHGHVITGIDFCHVEEGHPPREKAEFFAAVREFNDRHPHRALAILYHVGESFRDKSLESAVRWVQEAAELGAHRLGHAISLGIDPHSFGMHERTESVAERLDQIAYDLTNQRVLAAAGVPVDAAALESERAQLERRPTTDTVTMRYDTARLDEVRVRQQVAMAAIARTGAVIEVCPTSNRRIGGITRTDHHPVHRFVEAGLRIVVSSDDPGLFGIDIHDEFDWVETNVGLDRRDLLEAAWAARSETLVGRA